MFLLVLLSRNKSSLSAFVSEAMRCSVKPPGDVNFSKKCTHRKNKERHVKELEGLKEKTSIEDMYPVAPEPVSKYLYSR